MRETDGARTWSLGTIRVKGERNVLLVPASELIRLRSNPFRDYITQTMVGQIGTGE